MTTATANDLERALVRAAKNGVRITAWGTVKSTGQRFATVKGAHGQYVVLVGHAHLSCSCPARGLCTHRAVVNAALRRQAEAQRAERETREQVTAAERASAPLRRSNAPISIFK